MPLFDKRNTRIHQASVFVNVKMVDLTRAAVPATPTTPSASTAATSAAYAAGAATFGTPGAGSALNSS